MPGASPRHTEVICASMIALIDWAHTAACTSRAVKCFLCLISCNPQNQPGQQVGYLYRVASEWTDANGLKCSKAMHVVMAGSGSGLERILSDRRV